MLIDYSAVGAVGAPPPPVQEAPLLVNEAYSEERVREELKRAEEKKGGGQCVICWDAPAEAACVPCGHIAGCVECLNDMIRVCPDRGCPVCRTTIERVIKVFQV